MVEENIVVLQAVLSSAKGQEMTGCSWNRFGSMFPNTRFALVQQANIGRWK